MSDLYISRHQVLQENIPTHTHRVCDVHACSMLGSNEQVGRGGALSCTDVPFIMRPHDITSPAGSWALEPRLLHTRLQKAKLLGGARKPAMGVLAREFNYAGARPSAHVCVSLTSCCPPPLPSGAEARCSEVTRSKYPEALCFHAF